MWFRGFDRLKLWFSRSRCYKNHSKSLGILDGACFDRSLFPQNFLELGVFLLQVIKFKDDELAELTRLAQEHGMCSLNYQ
ncbi:hypothetical protein L1887_34587 [Cichorium endivia]|nr:hypothetical protein L1887_34587 [Cichorium endivia]